MASEREAFEAWWSSIHQTIGKVAAWEAWQACVKRKCERCAETVEHMMELSEENAAMRQRLEEKTVAGKAVAETNAELSHKYTKLMFDHADLRQRLDGQVPDGWKLVPIEPTKEMIDAYVNVDGRFSSARSDWEAMLGAAPQPAEGEKNA